MSVRQKKKRTSRSYISEHTEGSFLCVFYYMCVRIAIIVSASAVLTLNSFAY